ncbi:hypothetical protein D1823_02345 [Ruegeria sp. AD91A]|nr:hypothetical protein D1823_02345 [Ruegeria sp. AD91A]
MEGHSNRYTAEKYYAALHTLTKINRFDLYNGRLAGLTVRKTSSNISNKFEGDYSIETGYLPEWINALSRKG